MRHPPICTIGHSTRALDALVELLRANRVAVLADVRTMPRSRRMPHVSREALAATLPDAGIGYRHLPSLGGWRRASPDSPNAGLRHPAFRGYADHMRTPEFEEGLAALIAMAQAQRTAIMCAEAVPWRCHRQLLSDALTARGVPVLHIIDASPPRPHALTAAARVEDGRVSYPAPEDQLAWPFPGAGRQ